MRKYGYCITINRELKITNFNDIYNNNKDEIRYIISGTELGKKNDKHEQYKHYQVYIQLFKQHRFKSIKDIFNDNTIHIEEQKGTNTHARNYCWKGDNNEKGTDEPAEGCIYEEYGLFCEGQGSRPGMLRIKKLLDDGWEHKDIVKNDNDFITYSKHLTFFKWYKHTLDEEIFNKERNPIEVNVIYGSEATGKTTSIRKKEGYSNCYKLTNPNKDNKHWNGYNGQKVLIIDDFYSWLPLNDMLHILDNKPYRVRKLMDYEYAQWEKVYITSNISPFDWYPNCLNEEVKKAFFSRLTKCLKVRRGNTEPYGLSVKFIELPARNRHEHQDYLDLDDYFK